jgi:hypothetical protein
MKRLVIQYGHIALSLLLFVGVWVFWAIGFPHALSYQEQYQLFQWTGDYFIERCSVAGGLADWIGEFIVQFYYWPWLGALLLALLFVAIHRLCLALTARLSPLAAHLLSLLPVVVLWWMMGDINLLLSFVVAVMLALAMASIPLKGRWQWADVLIVPVGYWLIGPLVWLYVLLRVVQRGWRWLWLAVWLPVVQWAAAVWLLPQWPMQSVMLSGITYYRIPMQYPQLKGFDADIYELVRQDYMVRNERWDDIIERAGEHVVETPFWSNCVNLALSQKRQLAERQFDFYQSGDDALIMPSVRDMTSNLPSAEAFFRLGLVNSAQRYMFDIQESILNAKKSGRCTKRIVECMLINGHYKPVVKHISLLKKSLFYRSWAEEAERVVTADSAIREERINSHPVWGRLRQLRFKNDFLYSHGEKDKIFGLLFMDNHDNKMALDYFIAELLLRGDVQAVMQSMQWAEQYGGYRYMPAGYQDAMRCIQSHGQASGSKYGAYVRRMMQKGGKP